MYNIFHTERNSFTQKTESRAEGPAAGFDSRDEAARYLVEMKRQARRDGASEYADALHVDRA